MAPNCLPPASNGLYFVTCDNAVQQCPFLVKTHNKGKSNTFQPFTNLFKVHKLSWGPISKFVTFNKKKLHLCLANDFILR